MTITKTFRLEKELPRYNVGDIIYQKYDMLPSQYNDRLYKANEEFYVMHGKTKVQAISYVGEIISRVVDDQNINMEDWVTLLDTKED